MLADRNEINTRFLAATAWQRMNVNTAPQVGVRLSATLCSSKPAFSSRERR
jgi:hypothetical protein